MSNTVARRMESAVTNTAVSVTVGSDLLSLISTAMYVEPLTIYREYVQNAADSVDEARRLGLLGPDQPGSVEIALDPAARSIRILDTGTGIAADVFGMRMRALGASGKRGIGARGFRGVGRLGGLAYAQRLAFRSRSAAGEPVMEINWDCRRLRAGLKKHTSVDLADFVEEITALGKVDGDWPDRFFEVELAGVVRQGDDRLLRGESVADYLAQVASVPFDRSFALASDLESLLEPHLRGPRLSITVDGGQPLTRPHRDKADAGAKEPVILGELSTFEVPGLEGGIAAVGWVAHHGYEGAIPQAAMIKGLRARVGDIQVGGSSLLQDVFPETRFCAWTVGEVHVLDPRIVPNGRRDDFEQNGHYANLLNHLAPVGRDIARRCRVSSADRQRRRNIETQAVVIEQQLEVLEQGALGSSASSDLARTIGSAIARLEKAVGPDDLIDEERRAIRARIEAQRTRLVTSGADEQPATPLDRIPSEKRGVYQEMIDLIYECSTNRVAAKSLVDRILARIEELQGLPTPPGSRRV